MQTIKTKKTKSNIFFLILLIFLLFPKQSKVSNNVSNNISNNGICINNQTVKISESPSDSDIDYLIITSEEYKNSLLDLIEWKSQKGLSSEIITVSQIINDFEGIDTPQCIKNCIQSYYESFKTQWVLLAGDEDDVPSKNAEVLEGYENDGDFVSCDLYFSDLNDSDYDYQSEVYVGRLCANTINEMDSLVQNILDYEKNPTVGSWMTSALYAGAMLVFDQDWNDGNDNHVDFEECDANRHFNFLADRLPQNWNKTLLAEDEGLKNSSYYYDISISQSNLEDQINLGNSIVSICGHGWPQGMIRLKWTEDYDEDGLFDYTADPYLGGGSRIDEMEQPLLIDTSANINLSQKLGMYYLGGCSCGTFDGIQDCISEFFLKNGGIGCIGGSNVVWGEDQWYERDHGGWYSEGLQSRFWEYLIQYNQPGKAFALAKEDYVNDSRIIECDYPKWEEKILKQFNLLGDPEVPIWLSIPKQLNFTKNITNDKIFLNITAEGQSVPNVSVILYDGEYIVWKAITEDKEEIILPFNSSFLEDKALTIWKNGYLPLQEIGSNYPSNISTTTSTSETSTTTTSNEPNSTTDTNSTIFGIAGYSLKMVPILFIGTVITVYAIIYERKKKKNC